MMAILAVSTTLSHLTAADRSDKIRGALVTGLLAIYMCYEHLNTGLAHFPFLCNHSDLVS